MNPDARQRGQAAIAYIHTFQWHDHAPGLQRIQTLLQALGNPHRTLRFVHVAGTNGKGSTCACISAILQAAGYRVGLNTSPYLDTFHERIRVNGEMISDEALAALTERVRPVAEAMEEHPTEFELITAIALLHFQAQGCDLVILEVGLGGALDASNVIDTPEVAVLTAMGMDHVRELGPTQGDIAAAKAGIIKPGGAVVSHGGCPDADHVFRETCARQGTTLTKVDFFRLHVERQDLTGSHFSYAPYQGLFLPLVGRYQLENAAVAITAVEVLRQKGWRISDSDLRAGLRQVRWPGRLEVLRRAGPIWLLDGAHNPHGIIAMADSLRSLFPAQKLVFLVGVLADKSVESMLAPLVPLAAGFVTLRPDSPRAMTAKALEALLLPWGVPVYPCETTAQGVSAANDLAGSEGVVCALGSLYLSAAVRQAVEAQE